MAEEKQCPLKVVSANPRLIETTCQPDCAWYITELKMCAIKVIAKTSGR